MGRPLGAKNKKMAIYYDRVGNMNPALARALIRDMETGKITKKIDASEYKYDDNDVSYIMAAMQPQTSEIANMDYEQLHPDQVNLAKETDTPAQFPEVVQETKQQKPIKENKVAIDKNDKIFLFTGTVALTQPGIAPQQASVTRIVIAKSEEEATRKFSEAYTSLNSDTARYQVISASFSEAIV